MAMVIELPDVIAKRVTAAATARGISPTDVVSELVTISLTDPVVASSEVDPFEAFIGCGASGDRRNLTIHQLRDELSAAHLGERS